MDRRRFLQTTGAASASLAAGWPRVVNAAPEPPSKRAGQPNLVFVLADQWRFSAFGHGTDEVVQTPHIDALAKTGTRFSRAYACNPVCTPNRSVLLTGRYTHQTGMTTNDLMIPPSEICMAEVLKERGYATHYIGKWHLDGVDKPGFVPPGWRRRGFDTFEGFNRGHLYHRSQTFADDGTLLKPDAFEPTYQTDRAIDYIEKHRDEPFYMYLSWGPPHTPYNPPANWEKYTAADIVLRDNVPLDKVPEAKVRRDLAGYYGLCSALDAEMGRLVAALEKNGLRDNTLVVFTSDHGDLHGSHAKYHKGEPEEESLHVPLIANGPGLVKPGEVRDDLVSSLDLMPTLLAAVGATPPETCEGANLAPLLRGEEVEAPDFRYCEGKVNTAAAWRCVVTDRHKLAVDVKGEVTHLFDLANDPLERENKATDAGATKLRGELHTLLRDTGTATGDAFPNAVPQARKIYTNAEARAARMS